MKKYTLCLLLYACGGSLRAQQLPVSAGGAVSHAAGSISYSVGQVFYAAHSGGSVQEGLQQAYESQTTIVSRSEYPGAGISVFPNPTSGRLTVNMKSPDPEVRYVIADIQGRIVGQGTVLSASGQLTFAAYISGVYTLTLAPSDMKPQTFTIIKQ